MILCFQYQVKVRLFSNPACHSERSEESRDPSLSLRVTTKHPHKEESSKQVLKRDKDGEKRIIKRRGRGLQLNPSKGFRQFFQPSSMLAV